VARGKKTYSYDREAWEAKQHTRHLPPPITLEEHETEIYYDAVDAWWAIGPKRGSGSGYRTNTDNYREAQAKGVAVIGMLRVVLTRLTEVTAGLDKNNWRVWQTAVSKTVLNEFKHLPCALTYRAMKIHKEKQ